jgi:hypothetical protein
MDHASDSVETITVDRGRHRRGSQASGAMRIQAPCLRIMDSWVRKWKCHSAVQSQDPCLHIMDSVSTNLDSCICILVALILHVARSVSRSAGKVYVWYIQSQQGLCTCMLGEMLRSVRCDSLVRSRWQCEAAMVHAGTDIISC